jgi:hypothetical protein
MKLPRHEIPPREEDVQPDEDEFEQSNKGTRANHTT